VRERAGAMHNTAPAPLCGPDGASVRFAYCVNGHGWGQVDENGLCLRRCLKSRKARRQAGIRKEVRPAVSRASKQANVMVP
jgi:hypothetical protein